jgi:opacity protein-like surface antigen
MNKLLSTCIALSIFSISPAQAQDTWYDPTITDVITLNSPLNDWNIGAEWKIGLKDYDTSIILSPKFGEKAQFYGIGAEYNFNKAFRTSLMYTYALSSEYYKDQFWSKTYDISWAISPTLKHSTHIFMLNGYYDLDCLEYLTPYIGGGLGYADHHYILSIPRDTRHPQYYKLGDNKKHKGALAYAIYAGANYNISTATSLGLGYQFSQLGQDIKGDDVVNITSDAFGFGDYSLLEVKNKAVHSITLNLMTKF